ncbi:MAG: DUF2065 domain-containing protein [Candidatus Nitrosotenuis sp.]|nr:MAG: DUF2065 domain-containing protein [Candidatus Nitrosotenuis sp.]
MELFMSALGLVLIIEGLPYFVSPQLMQRYALGMAAINPAVLRVGGLALMFLGLGILYVFVG